MTDPANAASREARGVDRMIRTIPAHRDRNWPCDPIQETEREWMRPLYLAALADEAASQPREVLDDARALVDALRDEVSPPHVFEAWDRLHNSLDALNDTAPTDQVQGGGDVERLREALQSAPIPGLYEDNAEFRRRSDAWLAGPYRAALSQSNPTDGGMAL